MKRTIRQSLLSALLAMGLFSVHAAEAQKSKTYTLKVTFSLPDLWDGYGSYGILELGATKEMAGQPQYCKYARGSNSFPLQTAQGTVLVKNAKNNLMGAGKVSWAVIKGSIKPAASTEYGYFSDCMIVASIKKLKKTDFYQVSIQGTNRTMELGTYTFQELSQKRWSLDFTPKNMSG